MKKYISKLFYPTLSILIATVTCIVSFQVPVAAAANMSVTSRTPSFNQLNVAVDTDISVTFSANINNVTVNANTFNVDGSLSGKIAGTYSLNDDTVTFEPATNLRFGETVTVTLTTGIQSTFATGKTAMLRQTVLRELLTDTNPL